MGHSYEACSSVRQNGNGDQLLYNSYHRLGTHCHLGSSQDAPYSENTKVYIFRYDYSTERFEKISS